MKIALIGYGKMGKAVEEIALQQGHHIVLKINSSNQNALTPQQLSVADVAIESTGPTAAVHNIITCINAGIPVVSGSTGWLSNWEEVKQYCLNKNGALLYASYFSIGVNLFFAINRFVAGLMAQHSNYTVSIEEIHHTQKKDAPSGTAITLAEDILEKIPFKKEWVNQPATHAAQLSIISKRINNVPGTHKVKYNSEADSIELIHTAHNRKGFAEGALKAAAFLYGKKGVFTMKDVLGV
jgi:4-hydroxy-tetrahydrodipicolinate reductase